MRLRVLLCSNQCVVRAGLRLLLESRAGVEVVGETDDSHRLVTIARQLEPAIVLLDVPRRSLDAVSMTRMLARPDHGRPIDVVVLATEYDQDQTVQMLQAGASGLLLREDPAEDLMTALRVVAARKAFLSPSVTRGLLDLWTGRASPPLTDPPRPLACLTVRELEVLRLLAEGESNLEIAESLSLSAATVKSHVSHLLAKLGVRDRAQAVVLAYKSGFVRQPARWSPIGGGEQAHPE